MSAKLISPPAKLAVSLTDAKANLRIPASDTALDAVIQAWLMGVIEYAEHLMGRALVSQTWRVSLDAFPDAIKLPRPPVASVTSVKYYDANNALQTLDPALYEMDSMAEPCRILATPGVAWPATYARNNAVIAEVICGYGDDETTTPPAIKLYILAKLAEQFDPSGIPEKDSVQATFIDHLLDRYRIWEL